MFKARLRHKISGHSGYDQIKIIESGKENKTPFVKLNSGEIFFHRFFKDPLYEIFTRYFFSHYEIDKKPHPQFGIHRNHTDNLLSLKIDEKTRIKLLNKMPIKKGDTVMELGAFCGFGSMKLSNLVGNEGKVISIEVDKTNFDILQKNIRANNIKNIIPINTGIWNKKGTLTLFKEKNQRNSLVEGLVNNPSENENTNEKVNVNTVDNILEENNIDHLDFLSMEINAAEIECLRGMKKTLNQKSLRVVGAGWYDYQGTPEWKIMKNILEKNGFDVYIGVQNRVFALKQ